MRPWLAQSTPDVSGVLGGILAGLGVPGVIAATVGSAITFAVVSVVLFTLLRRIFETVTARFIASRGLADHVRAPIERLGLVLAGFIAVTIAFGAAGFGDFLQSLATIAAAATLAVGLATQDVLKNLVAGVFIYTDQPFKIGDQIEWDDHAGIVEDISFRVSRIRTFDKELLTVPNSTMTDGVIKNVTDGQTRRITIDVGIGYEDDIDTAAALMEEIAEGIEGVRHSPPPSTRLKALGDNAVIITARLWLADPARGDATAVRASFLQGVKERFDAAGIDLPYPTRVLEGSIIVTE
jgi:small-conductance mechanosensitive channel